VSLNSCPAKFNNQEEADVFSQIRDGNKVGVRALTRGGHGAQFL
jgi:hypothetical protein